MPILRGRRRCPQASPWRLPTNAERAAWAERAVRYFARASGQGREPLETSVVDLLADLMHLAEREGLDLHRLAERAHLHFSAELEEAARGKPQRGRPRERSPQR